MLDYRKVRQTSNADSSRNVFGSEPGAVGLIFPTQADVSAAQTTVHQVTTRPVAPALTGLKRELSAPFIEHFAANESAGSGSKEIFPENVFPENVPSARK